MVWLRPAGLLRLFCWILAAGLARPGDAFNPAAGDFSKADPNHLRVLSYNTERQFIADATQDAAFQRILRAIAPDVIVFQEIDSSVTVNALATRLNAYFPGQTWNVHFGVTSFGDFALRNALCSRYPLSMQIVDSNPTSDTGARGLTAALVDLPNAVWGTQNLYMMGVHWKSGGEATDHQRRQVQADAAVNWMRDARTAGGSINLPAQTAMIIAGDMNLSFQGGGDDPPYHASSTIIDGGVYFTVTYGQSSPPDWDGSMLTDATPYDHNTGDPDTHNSTATVPYSRHDRIIYTDSVIRTANRYILSTRRMTSGALSAAGLQVNDTSNAADHLPIVADFAPGAEAAPGKLLINEFSYDDASTDDRTFLELINTGGQPINLDAPRDYWFVRTTNNAVNSPPATTNQSARTDLKGVVPPGGVFVLYSTGSDSTGVSSLITSTLPALQRQAATLTLPNGPDVVIGLIEDRPISISGNQDVLVEAYLYEDSAPGDSHYLLTNTDVPLLIQVQGAQLSTFSTATDNTFSRKRGDKTANSFADWVIPDTATPGLQNNTLLPQTGAGTKWALYR